MHTLGEYIKEYCKMIKVHLTIMKDNENFFTKEKVINKLLALSQQYKDKCLIWMMQQVKADTIFMFNFSELDFGTMD